MNLIIHGSCEDLLWSLGCGAPQRYCRMITKTATCITAKRRSIAPTAKSGCSPAEIVTINVRAQSDLGPDPEGRLHCSFIIHQIPKVAVTAFVARSHSIRDFTLIPDLSLRQCQTAVQCHECLNRRALDRAGPSDNPRDNRNVPQKSCVSYHTSHITHHI
jgi:hypothetical protein